jgi:hypothetical protein
MKSPIIVVGCVVLACAGAAVAQQPSASVDLNGIAALSPSPLVAVHLAFTDTDAACPEEHGTLQLSGGEMRLHRVVISGQSPPGLRRGHKPIDNETYEYWIATKDCWVDIAVRLQIRRDDAWTSLLVPVSSRPEMSPGERREAMRQLMERNRDRATSQDVLARLREAANTQRSASGLLGDGNGTTSAAFFFDDAPKTCLEAVGAYQVSRDGVTFSFLAHLPGDVNRFAIERADVDSYRSRLYFTRGDCRYQITVGASTWYHYDWAPRRLVLIPPLR